MGNERFIFWFWESPTTGWHARSKNTFILIMCIYFYLTCSTIRSTIYFSKPLLCVMLICDDWSHFHFIMPVMSDKAAFLSSVLLCVQPLPGKLLFLPLLKQHLVAKNEFAFSFRPTRKDQQVCKLTSTWNGLGFVLKKRLVSMIQSRLFLLRDNNFIHGELSDSKLCRMFSFT